MKTTEQFIALLREHAGEMKKSFGITSMRLFGSVARGEHSEDSDVDVLVQMPPKAYQVADALIYLENMLGCKVDLIRDRDGLRPSFRQTIDRDAIIVF